MTSKLTGPDGRRLAKTLVSVAPVNHCGGCHHAVLMPQEDGTLDINALTCVEGPPQICHIPVYRPGPRVPVPGMPGMTTPGQPVLVGMQEVAKYPTVGRQMRACHRWVERTEQDTAVEKIDAANNGAETPIEGQQKN